MLNYEIEIPDHLKSWVSFILWLISKIQQQKIELESVDPVVCVYKISISKYYSDTESKKLEIDENLEKNIRIIIIWKMYKKANKLTIYKHNISVLNRKYIK